MTGTLVGFGMVAFLALFASRAAAALLWLGRTIVVLVVLAIVASALLHTGTWPTATTTTAERAAEPTSDAVPIPWAKSEPRWADPPRCPDAADPRAVLPVLQVRVDFLDALRSKISQDRGTTAIVRGENIVGQCLDFVAAQTNVNVEPSIRGALTPGERPVWQGTGLPDHWQVMHAEQKAVAAAWHAGFRPLALVSSRPFCDAARDPGRVSCQSWLAQAGAIQVADRQAVWAW